MRGYGAAAVLVLAGVLTPVAPGVGTQSASAADGRPNILLITTDDMADGDLAFMPKTRRLLKRSGVSFTDFIAPHPICCPSRAQILTGQYAQNNGVHHNEGPYGRYQALRQPNNTLASWLHRAGYKTALVGKFLNYWSGRGIPAGWTIFNPIVGGGAFRPYGYTAYRNGHPQIQKTIHTSDYVAERTVRYINKFSAANRPFFIWASQVAPHKMKRRDGQMVPPISPPRHAGLFDTTPAPSLQKASFNEADISDKPSYVRGNARESPDVITNWFRRRMRSLQAVDEGVAAAVAALRRTGELANTLVVFTSDNGYLLGEHRLTLKNFPYEESLQVPLLARGPGMPAGAQSNALASMIDLAPTFLDASGASPDRTIDGRSLFRMLTGQVQPQATLIQAGKKTRPWWWRGVRTPRYTYVRYETDGFVELYDRAQDPLELDNVAESPEYADVRSSLRGELDRLRICSGSTCW